MTVDSVNNYLVKKISSFAEFEALQENWNQLYLEDQNAQFYISWPWLNALLRHAELDWYILALQENETGSYISFFLFTQSVKKFYGVFNWCLLRLGAFPLGNYTSILIKPGYEELAIQNTTKFIQQNISWDKLFITNIIDPRFDSFISKFSENKYPIEKNPNPVSSRILLPDSWESYLSDHLGRSTRKTFTRLLRRLDDNENIFISNINEETAKSDIDILFNLWQERWGPQPNINVQKKIFYQLFKDGLFHLNILWDTSVPMASQGLIYDTARSTVYAFVTGFDKNYSKHSPGNMIGLYSIKKSIIEGFKYYEFYQGADSYKLTMGAELRYPTSLKITNNRQKTIIVEKLILLLGKLKSTSLSLLKK